MRITVVVCTWNRAEMLRGTLASLAEVEAPAGVEWDVLVVDNASTDHTAEVVAGFDGDLALRRIEEPEPGLSHARNRAVREHRADYLVWLDDDVELERGWLRAYAEAFRSWPEAAVFGGPIRPRLEGDPPSWLPGVLDLVAHTYARLDLGAEDVPLGPDVDRLPFGANYALRAREQARHLYPVGLGRRHGALRPGGEEIEVMAAILAEGGSGRWVPGAGVDHRIGADRQSIAYLRRYAISDALHEAAGAAAASAGPVRSLPRLLARAAVLEARYRLRRLVARPRVWVADLLAAGDAWGRVRARLSGADGPSTERAPR